MISCEIFIILDNYDVFKNVGIAYGGKLLAIVSPLFHCEESTRCFDGAIIQVSVSRSLIVNGHLRVRGISSSLDYRPPFH